MDSWTFDTLKDEKMKPMPIAGAAQQAAVMGFWGGLSGTMKAVYVAGVVLVVTGVSIGIAGAAGAFNPSDKSEITLRALTYNCTDSALTADYTMVLAASGSSYHTTATWEGTLYTKDADASGTGGCNTDSITEVTNWPPVTSNTSTVPDLPAGVTATPTMWLGGDGYYYLRINGCQVYHYSSNTADAWWQGISATWPVVETDGTVKTAAPVCS